MDSVDEREERGTDAALVALPREGEECERGGDEVRHRTRTAARDGQHEEESNAAGEPARHGRAGTECVEHERGSRAPCLHGALQAHRCRDEWERHHCRRTHEPSRAPAFALGPYDEHRTGSSPRREQQQQEEHSSDDPVHRLHAARRVSRGQRVDERIGERCAIADTEAQGPGDGVAVDRTHPPDHEVAAVGEITGECDRKYGRTFRAAGMRRRRPQVDPGAIAVDHP